MTVADPALIALFVRLDNKPASFVREKLFGKELAANAGNYRFADRRFFSGLDNILRSVAGGIYTANVWAAVSGVASPAVMPVGRIACVQATSAGQTVTFTFGTVAIVLTEGAAGANGFARGASNTTEAAALAVCINAHPVLGGVFTATPSVGNCDIAGKIPGAFLTDVLLAGGTGFTATQLGVTTAGVEGTHQFFPQHLRINRTP